MEDLYATTHVWLGAYGARYTYCIHDIEHWTPPEGRLGNVIYAKFVGGFWVPVFVAGGVYDPSRLNGPYDDSIRKKGVTHVHWHASNTINECVVEAKDILDGNPEAYSPLGCNDPAHPIGRISQGGMRRH